MNKIILSIIATALMLPMGADMQIAVSQPVYKLLMSTAEKEMKKEKAVLSDSQDSILANDEPNEETPLSASNQDDCDKDKFGGLDNARLEIYSRDAQKTLDDAKSFTPGRDWYVSDGGNEYLQAAISPSGQKRLKEGLGRFYPCIKKIVDEIATVATKTLPLYKPVGYNVKNAAEEKLMRMAVSGLDQAKVLQTGMRESNWIIDKNDYGVPTVRFKHGMIHAQYPKTISDDGYCTIIYVNILQDYAGGGTYGTSYPIFIRSEPAGCTVGK